MDIYLSVIAAAYNEAENLETLVSITIAVYGLLSMIRGWGLLV